MQRVRQKLELRQEMRLRVPGDGHIAREPRQRKQEPANRERDSRDQPEHPTRRCVTLGDLGDHLDCGLGPELGPAPARRLVEPEQPARDELLHRRVGHAPQLLGLGTPSRQGGGELLRLGDRVLTRQGGETTLCAGNGHRRFLRSRGVCSSNNGSGSVFTGRP